MIYEAFGWLSDSWLGTILPSKSMLIATMLMFIELAPFSDDEKRSYLEFGKKATLIGSAAPRRKKNAAAQMGQ